VDEYVRLNQATKPFARIAHGRYINFMSEFLAAERGGDLGTGDERLEAGKSAGRSEGLSLMGEVSRTLSPNRLRRRHASAGTPAHGVP